jgi:hypothetical protein
MKLRLTQSDNDGAARLASLSKRAMVPAMSVALLVTAGLACSPATAGASSKSKSPSKLTSAVTPKQFFSATGTGSKNLSASKLPKAWTVTWTFDCQSPATTGTFALTSAKVGKTAAKVTSQTGLGGGGHLPYTGAGAYTFGVTTTCAWTVKVNATPKVPIKAAVTTTTTPSAKKSKATKSKVATTTTTVANS